MVPIKHDEITVSKTCSFKVLSGDYGYNTPPQV